MSSIRRPKRLIIRGDDERDHPVLVKSGEDLRQDQRIQQLLSVMNILLGSDAACAQRGLQLRTYQVVPLTTRCAAFRHLLTDHRRNLRHGAVLAPLLAQRVTCDRCPHRIGLIEWMENTCTLKEFLSATMTTVEQRRAAGYVTPGSDFMGWYGPIVYSD